MWRQDFESAKKRHLIREKYGFWGIVTFVSIVAIIIVSLIITFIFIYKMHSNFGSATSRSIGLDTTNTVGVFIGGVIGPLITLASVLLLFFNLRLQSLTLTSQRQQQQQQELLSKRMQFEGTFYKLVDYQREILKNVKYKFLLFGTLDIEEEEGTNFFERISEKLEYLYSFVKAVNENRELNPVDFDSQNPELLNLVQDYMSQIRETKNELEIATLTYEIFFNIYYNQLGHYFRHLYHILKFIRSQEKEEEGIIRNSDFQVWINGELAGLNSPHEKYKFYSDFLQAQMSSSELLILFYNGLKFPESKKLLHHFNFLENLCKEDLLNPEHEKFYEEWNIEKKKYPAIHLKSRKKINTT